MPSNLLRFTTFFFFFVIIAGCRQAQQKVTEHFSVNVRLAADPGMLNPLLSLNGYAEQVQGNIFMGLQEFDPITLSLRPALAIEKPLMETIKTGSYAGGVAYHFQIQKNAIWDNGAPVLASDYVFTLKALLNPSVGAPYRSFFDFVGDVVIDKSDPKRFTIFTNKTYILSEAALSTLAVLPEYIYDPNGLLQSYSIPDLQNDSVLNLRKADLERFANEFKKRATDPQQIIGCGPYALAEWETGQRIVLEKKENWWGGQLAKKQDAFIAEAQEIRYKIIPDNAAALTALKDGQLDVMSEIEALSFSDLQQNNYITEQFHLYTPPYLSYYYIALNAKRSTLNDIRVRKAIAHLADVDQMMQAALQGFAKRVTGPIHPSMSFHNDSLHLISFDIEKAKALLADAGWTDSDDDGILDKNINGKKEQLSLRYIYSTGNKTGEAVALILKQAALKVGIGINITGMEFGTALKAYRARDYDLAYFLWSNMPGPQDMKQIWHTSSDTPTGANRTGFGDSASDALIDSIRVTLDDKKRKDLYLRLQRRIYADQPYIFLYTPLERIAINKKFEASTSALRPGFSIRHFRLQKTTVNQ